jgi:hypothetical protein
MNPHLLSPSRKDTVNKEQPNLRITKVLYYLVEGLLLKIRAILFH